MKLTGKYGRFRAELEYDLSLINGTRLANCKLTVYMNEKLPILPPAVIITKRSGSVIRCEKAQTNSETASLKFLALVKGTDPADIERRALSSADGMLESEIAFIFDEGYTVWRVGDSSTLVGLCKRLQQSFVSWTEYLNKCKGVRE